MSLGMPPFRVATELGMLERRPRTAAHAGLVRALFADSRRAELTALGGDDEDQRAYVDLQLRARDIHRDRTRPQADLGVVTLDGIAVGQLDVHSDGDAVEVLEVAVVPGLRGHGVGRAALEAVVAWADDAGLPVRLHVEPDNPARRLYERLGFVADGSEGIHLAMARPPSAGVVGGPPASGPDAPGRAAVGDGPVDGAVGGLGSPRPPELPTFADLAAHVGAVVPCPMAGTDLSLVSVEARPRRSPGGVVPYSALLEGPVEAALGQGTYLLDMPVTGPVELFLVPLGPEAGRALYEVIVG